MGKVKWENFSYIILEIYKIYFDKIVVFNNAIIIKSFQVQMGTTACSQKFSLALSLCLCFFNVSPSFQTFMSLTALFPLLPINNNANTLIDTLTT